MDRDIIDLQDYLLGEDREGGAGAFSVWGGEGHRARLALPVWRSIYLLNGKWGGVVWDSGEPPSPQPFFVLDLEKEPARIQCPTEVVSGLEGTDPASLRVQPGGTVVVKLGEGEDRHWFLVVRGARAKEPLSREIRENLLFLAGECAGLLFHRRLAREGLHRKGS